LTNNKVMVSSGGKIVESALDITPYYGHMYANAISQSVTITSSGTFYRVPASMTGGTCSGVTFQNSRELLVANAGTYVIQWSMSVIGNGNNENIAGSFMINNNGTGGVGVSLLAQSQGCSSSTARPTSISGSCTVTLAANAVIALCVTNRSTSSTVVVSYANLTLHKIA
jgi:hypothetical protein